MKKSYIITIIVIILILIGAYIWWAYKTSEGGAPYGTTANETSTAPSQSTSKTVPPKPLNTAATTTPATLTLNVSSGDVVGDHLVATNGMTLYKYNQDGVNISNCTSLCAATWPPYTVSAKQSASLSGGAGVAGKIATIRRADGSLQVTYKGAPLYFYIHDTKTGNTNGQFTGGFTLVSR